MNREQLEIAEFSDDDRQSSPLNSAILISEKIRQRKEYFRKKNQTNHKNQARKSLLDEMITVD
jgi:hypothetical protein